MRPAAVQASLRRSDRWRQPRSHVHPARAGERGPGRTRLLGRRVPVQLLCLPTIRSPSTEPATLHNVSFLAWPPHCPGPPAIGAPGGAPRSTHLRDSVAQRTPGDSRSQCDYDAPPSPRPPRRPAPSSPRAASSAAPTWIVSVFAAPAQPLSRPPLRQLPAPPALPVLRVLNTGPGPVGSPRPPAITDRGGGGAGPAARPSSHTPVTARRPPPLWHRQRYRNVYAPPTTIGFSSTTAPPPHPSSTRPGRLPPPPGWSTSGLRSPACRFSNGPTGSSSGLPASPGSPAPPRSSPTPSWPPPPLRLPAPPPRACA
jgi:hypothetical protein